jgi:hypothetical protein
MAGRKEALAFACCRMMHDQSSAKMNGDNAADIINRP